MTCEEIHGELVLAAYGELDPPRRVALLRHISACAPCAVEAREIFAARELVARAEGHELPEPLVTPRVSRRPLLWAASVAAVIALAFAGWQATRAPETRVAAVRAPARASGAVGVSGGASAVSPLTDDAFDSEVKSLQTELSSLESRSAEF